MIPMEFILTAVVLFCYAWVRHPHLLKVDRPSVLKYGTLIVVINFLKVVGLSLYAVFKEPEALLHTAQIFDLIPPNALLAVWWEDCFYVLPFLIIMQRIDAVKNYWLKSIYLISSTVLFLIAALHFMAGHAYQGPAGMVTIIYPIISFFVARRKGLGTMLILHILFDISAVATFWAFIKVLGYFV